MSAVNTKAIVDYVEKRLSPFKAFTDVRWACIEKTPSREKHLYRDAHGLVSNLVSKAGGNFLWTTIVVDRVCESLRIYSNDLNSLIKHVDNIPNKVEDLFRDMILQRPEDDSKPVMAMALWIALLPYAYMDWIYFWLLAVSGQKGAVSIKDLDPELVVTTTYHELNKETTEAMRTTTKNFLDHYCRDVLSFDPPLSKEWRYLRRAARRFHGHTVAFRHRMMYDYCHT